MLTRLFCLVAVMALALMISAPVQAADDIHEGKVVKVDGNKLVMTDKGGKEHSHTIGNTTKITIDGKEAKLADLKAGQEITLTMDKKEVSKIEAKK